MGYFCIPNDRELKAKKILKIMNWPTSINLTETKAFLGIYVYYYIWIIRFAVMATPLYILFQKNKTFIWGIEQHQVI